MRDELVKMDSNNISMADTVATAARIREYYNTCENAYRDFWDLDHSGLMSLGFWPKGTRNLRQALVHQNDMMAARATIRRSDFVLDAGCGVGGSATFLADKFGCKVVGITLIAEQVTKARDFARRRGVEELASFQQQDYLRTNFADSTFDVVWAIESICYAEPKRAFIEEAFRLLKPGGRLIIAENLATKSTLTASEKSDLMDNAYHLCMVNSIDTSEQYTQHLRQAGFNKIAIEDVTDLIRPSIKRLYWGYFPATIYNRMMHLFGRKFSEVQLGNTKMLYYLYKTLRRNLWAYGLIYAEKPKTPLS